MGKKGFSPLQISGSEQGVTQPKILRRLWPWLKSSYFQQVNHHVYSCLYMSLLYLTMIFYGSLQHIAALDPQRAPHRGFGGAPAPRISMNLTTQWWRVATERTLQ